jgi:hypothetical protein
VTDVHESEVTVDQTVPDVTLADVPTAPVVGEAEAPTVPDGPAPTLGGRGRGARC